MATSPLLKFYLTVDDFLAANCNFASSDVIKVALSNTIPAVANHYYSDLTDLATSNGYTAGGATTGTNSKSNTTGTTSVACTPASPTWTSSTGSLGPFRYFIFYDSTPATNKTLLVPYD